MNGRQKETIQSQLDSEKKTIRELKKVYEKARTDCLEKIKALEARTDVENLQSIVYQKTYQQALKTQLDSILDMMNGEQFDTISDYLGRCYENGFLGTMYDLHGQGIPLIIPINQKQVTKAIQTDSKISEGLYKRLGVDTKKLKDSIRANVSRGIAASQSWFDVANNIDRTMNINLNRAMRIARTEGHRIQSESAYDAQIEATNKGADIVKQWDSTLDERTRPSHSALDGQLREVNERFKSPETGAEGLYPGGFGVASEDVNCRCAILQRAKWALDEDELKELEERAKYFGLDKTEDFEDFKKKYLIGLETPIANGERIMLDIEHFPKSFIGKKSEKSNTQALVDYVNGLEGADENVLYLYDSMGLMFSFDENGIPFTISHANDSSLSLRYTLSTGKFIDVKLTIPKLEGEDLSGQIQTTLHEEMHFIDLMLRSDPEKHGEYFSAENQNLRKVFSQTSYEMSEEISQLFSQFKREHSEIEEKYREKYQKEVEELKKKYLPNGIWGKGSDYEGYRKQERKLWKEISSQSDYESRNIMGGGVCSLEDIYDAISGGILREDGTVTYGHGKSYYRSTSSRIDETVANFAALSVTRPDLVEMLKRDKPELVEALRENFAQMGKKVKELHDKE